jgi:drug/metabolite transporter (DMT)-like permease
LNRSSYSLQPKRRADAAMLLVTLFWGLTFPAIRVAVQDLDPFVFVAARFSLALIVFAPIVLGRSSSRGSVRAALVPGLILGVLSWAAYMSQTIGLTLIGAGRAAFITGISVILVPLLSPLFRAGRPRGLEFVAALVATFGLFLLTDPKTGGIAGGDLWVLLCALLYALYIHVLQIFLRRDPDTTALAFTQILGVAVLAWLALPLAATDGGGFTARAWGAILFCATLATIGTFWLQARFQGDTTPQRVALIFAMEPVFATLFAFLLLGEWLPPLGQMGALLILIAVLGVELLERPVAG